MKEVGRRGEERSRKEKKMGKSRGVEEKSGNSEQGRRKEER